MNIPLTPVRFLRYAEQQYPDRTAVVCGRERFTYSGLAYRVGRLAGALRNKRDLRKKYWQGQEAIPPEFAEWKRKGTPA